MKQLCQYQDGRLELQDVASPALPPGGIRVRTACSVISPGTEKMKVAQARMSLLQKAKSRPDQVRKVLDTARTLGWKAAYDKVKNRLESPSPLGYSAAGTVIEVDPLNTRFQVGDRVACGGADLAVHAEEIAIPDLLAAKIPDSVPFEAAAYTTLASISLEGVRQAAPRLGDRVLVVGQGLVGLLATRLLRLHGARVMACDLDPARLTRAAALGAEQSLNPRDTPLPDAVDAWTGGTGADAVLLCIGGQDPAFCRQLIDVLRDRGTLVVVGIYDLHLEWKEAYIKDISVRYSRSYGPGRYDPSYEWGGLDYPIGHVRWTENRNFEACLQLMHQGDLDLAPLTTRTSPFSDALHVYSDMMNPGNQDIGVVLTYPDPGPAPSPAPAVSPAPEATEATAAAGTRPALSATVPCIHVIGAGNFARTMLLPHLKDTLPLGTIVNGTGLSARHVQQKFGFADAATDPARIFSREGEAVLIATRHHLHAPQVLQALAAHQHVFVEKPLCLSPGELTAISESILNSRGSLMVGFNRRFAPATQTLRNRLNGIPGPKTISYHVCAGQIGKDHWYANRDESGGRILGEVCHFVDTFNALLNESPVRVSAQSLNQDDSGDSVSVEITFSAGSVAHLFYSVLGDSSFPKETWRVFARGLVAECENFQRLTLHARRKKQTLHFRSKGHAEEMHAWSSFLQGQSPHPFPYAAIHSSMTVTFAILEALRLNHPVDLPPARHP